ncbi:hypothetical protein ISS30_06035 [bacterium]|nr:hypothetical protein [bacterium]
MTDEKVNAYEPRMEIKREWLDRRLTAQEHEDTRKKADPPPREPPPPPEDRFQQVGPKSDTQPERTNLNDTTQRTADESREEYLRDERQMAEQSVVFRTYYKGGVGMNFDEKA